VSTPPTPVAKGYAEVASFLLERWSARDNDGPPGGSDARAENPAEVAARVSLSTASGLLALQALDSLAIVTGRQHEAYIVESEWFSTSLEGATLTVSGPLVNALGSDALPVEAIRVEPPALDPSATEFRLRADASGRRGATYLGTVTASVPGATEPVTVWIVVP
jgi:hypothetical protein